MKKLTESQQEVWDILKDKNDLSSSWKQSQQTIWQHQPVQPNIGDLWLDQSVQQIKMYDGKVWHQISWVGKSSWV